VRVIFSDFEIIYMKTDHTAPGVFFKAKKPEGWRPTNLDDIALYSVLLRKRTKEIIGIEHIPFIERLKFLGSRLLSPMLRALMRRR